MPPRRAVLLATGAFALGLAPARAHHGFGGRYDRTRPIYLEGVVRTASFRPPHPTVTIDVDASQRRPAALPSGDEFMVTLVLREEDRGRSVEVEFPPVSRFFGLGERIRVGERIAIVALRNCAAPHQLRGQWIRLADGTTVVRSGPMQTEVEGCSNS